VIEVENLVKRYGATVALDGISLAVDDGSLVAILGPNGAGKTTTVEIMEGHRRPTAGTVRVLGADPATAGPELRDRVGVVLQSSGIEGQLTLREVLELYGSAYRTPRPIDEVLALVGLADKAHHRIQTLSGGQQRRADLALGILGRPSVLFLDEPTTGFDPAARRGAWELVERLRLDGTTIVLTTHYLDEAEQLADRVVVLAGGRIVADAPPHELTATLGARLVRFALPHDPVPLPAGATVRDGMVEVSTHTPTQVLHDLTRAALDRGIELERLTVTTPSLEDVYLALLDTERG
jgi:ABC-2 type transport system ATP-binding protein